MGGNRTGDGIEALEADGLAGEKPGGNPLDAFRVGHPETLAAGPVVHRKKAVDIGGGGDHRQGAAGPGELHRQGVGAAQMAGQDGDGVGAQLVHHHHGGVAGLADHVGGDGPDGDAYGADEQKGFVAGETVRCPGRQFAVAAAVQRHVRHRRHEPMAQGHAGVGKGDGGDGHCLASRNSVEKSAA